MLWPSSLPTTMLPLDNVKPLNKNLCPHPPTTKSKQRTTLGLRYWYFFSNTTTQRNATSTISSLHSPQKQSLQSISFQPDTYFICHWQVRHSGPCDHKSGVRDFPASEENMHCSQGTVSLMTSKSSGPCSQPVSPKARLHRHPKDSIKEETQSIYDKKMC